MSRYRDDRDERSRDDRFADDRGRDDRVRDDRNEEFETRRGSARSYAEERFLQSQRDSRGERPRGDDDPRQFDYDPMDRESREQARRRSEAMGVHSDPEQRRRDDEMRRGDGKGVPLRYERSYMSRDGGENIYAEDDRAAGARDARPEDDYGRRRDAPAARTNVYTDAERQQQPAPRGASRSHVRCRDIMTRDVTVATRDTTLDHIAQMMRDEDTGVIPVVELAITGTATGADGAQISSAASDASASSAQIEAATGGTEAGARRGERSYGKLVGLVTDRDLIVRAIAEGKDASQTRVEDVMTTDVHTAEPNDRVIDAIRKMGDKQVRRIPVVDAQRNLRGIISMADVALETEEDRELARALEEISTGSSFWSRMFG